MTQTMIERVARAVRRRQFERTGRINSYDATVPPTENELDDARAAIEAMSEPTDEMLEEGDAAWSEAAGYQYSGVSEAYDAMIDAALNEETE